jgi:ankyrin repeat protein
LNKHRHTTLPTPSFAKIPRPLAHVFGYVLFFPTQKENHASGSTLHEACFRGDVGAVQACLDRGVGVNAVENSVSGTTPLHAACLSGQRAVVDLLLARKANVSAKDWRGDTPLHM